MNLVYEVDFPPSQFWFGTIVTTIQWMAISCSTIFIVSMTFDRFYSIIRPHKAASFNTVKRAKITIFCVTIFSINFNIPHLFTTAVEGRAVPLGRGMDTILGLFYYWFSLVVIFVLPFVLLLIMNSFIIHTLRRGTGSGISTQPTDTQHGNKGKFFAILLLVAFTFLILTTPTFVLTLYVMLVDFGKTAKSLAGFHLFYNVGHKTHFTNCGINFFLYVISGQKFRTDLRILFKRKSRSV